MLSAVRKAIFPLAHPMIAYVKSCTPGYADQQAAFAARFKLAAWVQPGGALVHDRVIPLSKLSWFYETQIKLEAAKLVVDHPLPPKGKLSLIIYGTYQEGDRTNYRAEITGFKIEGDTTTFIFHEPLSFGLEL